METGLDGTCFLLGLAPQIDQPQLNAMCPFDVEKYIVTSACSLRFLGFPCQA